MRIKRWVVTGISPWGEVVGEDTFFLKRSAIKYANWQNDTANGRHIFMTNPGVDPLWLSYIHKVDEGCLCRDSDQHDFYIRGGRFRWCIPTFDVLETTTNDFYYGLNRYPHVIIGAYVAYRSRGLGVRWKRS